MRIPALIRRRRGVVPGDDLRYTGGEGFGVRQRRVADRDIDGASSTHQAAGHLTGEGGGPGAHAPGPQPGRPGQ